MDAFAKARRQVWCGGAATPLRSDPGPDRLPSVTVDAIVHVTAELDVQVQYHHPFRHELDGAETRMVNALHGIRPIAHWISDQMSAVPALHAPEWRAHLDARSCVTIGETPMLNVTIDEHATFVPDLLIRLTERWGRRVAVKQDALDLDGHFDPAAVDFPERWVPLFGLSEAARLDREARGRILSAAWIAYNAKTSALEIENILPACRLLLEDRVPASRDSAAFSAIHQTIIDEHYHILMCHNAVGVTRRRRDLTAIEFDPAGWAVVEGLNDRREGHAGTSHDPIDIAFGRNHHQRLSFDNIVGR